MSKINKDWVDGMRSYSPGGFLPDPQEIALSDLGAWFAKKNTPPASILYQPGARPLFSAAEDLSKLTPFVNSNVTTAISDEWGIIKIPQPPEGGYSLVVNDEALQDLYDPLMSLVSIRKALATGGYI